MTVHVRMPETPEQAILVAVSGPVSRKDGIRWSEDVLIEEIRALAESAGAEVVDQVVQRRESADKKYYIGKGKAEELKMAVEASGADLVVFDNDLTPAQGKNLEDQVGVRVLDRSELILDIFAERARTREAKLQVELAQLQYLLPRLRRMWTHLSRIRGGIGLRGPGETQLEVDRRVIRSRISKLKEQLTHIEARRHLQRKSRRDAWNVALVGYTNVGKSTIMNRLTGESLRVENRLFATLDATTRKVELPEGEPVLLTDTVGFIRNLPHHLVASFRATLEEVLHADLLLHVIDISDPLYEDQIVVVERVLDELGVRETPILEVFNKFDLVPELDRAAVRVRVLSDHPDGVLASAVEARGLAALQEALVAFVRREEAEVRVSLPLDDARTLARLYDLGEVVSRRFTDQSIEVDLRTRPEIVAKLRREGIEIRAAS